MARSSPRVTVVVPCYNQGDFLPECLASVRAQTFEDWEAVLVDDGSDDGATPAACRALADPPRVRGIATENRGLPAARNRGAEGAAGDFLLFLDADDRLAPDALARWVAALDAHPEAAFAYGTTRTFGLRAEVRPRLAYNHFFELFANHWETTALVRRAAFRAAGGFRAPGPVAGYEDWDLWIRLGGAGYLGLAVPDAEFHYRLREGSMVAGAHESHDDLVRAIREKNAALYSGPALLAAKRAWAPAVSIVLDEAARFDAGATRAIEEIFLDFEVCRASGEVLWPGGAPPRALRPEPVIGKYVVPWDGRDPETFGRRLRERVAEWELAPPSIERAAAWTKEEDVRALSRMGEERMRRTGPAWLSPQPPESPDDLEGPRARLALFRRRAEAHGWRRVAWYGAGLFARRLLEDPACPVRPDALLDDRPPSPDLHGIPILCPDPATIDRFDAVLLTSDVYERVLLRRALALWPGAMAKVQRLWS